MFEYFVRLNPIGCTRPVFTQDGLLGDDRGGGDELLPGLAHGHGNDSQFIFSTAPETVGLRGIVSIYMRLVRPRRRWKPVAGSHRPGRCFCRFYVKKLIERGRVLGRVGRLEQAPDAAGEVALEAQRIASRVLLPSLRLRSM